MYMNYKYIHNNQNSVYWKPEDEYVLWNYE